MDDLKETGQLLAATYAKTIVSGDHWTHYKGGVYEIVALAVKEDTGEVCVVYKSLKYSTIWVRNINNWFDTVNGPDGSRVCRFNFGAP